jgi:hypothetical protein
VQHLPQSTATSALYLLTGSLPLEAWHHKSILTLFSNISRKEHSIEKEILQRQAAIKDLESNSHITTIRQLLAQYKRPPAYEILNNPQLKRHWKQMISNTFTNHWQFRLEEEAERKKSLSLLNLD